MKGGRSRAEEPEGDVSGDIGRFRRMEWVGAVIVAISFYRSPLADSSKARPLTVQPDFETYDPVECPPALTGPSGGGRSSFSAFGAGVVLIGRVFLETLVEGMTDLHTSYTNEINSLDRLINSLAIEDAAFELLDADTQEFLVLTLNLTAASFILGQVGIFIGDFRRFGEAGIQIALGRFGLVHFRHGLHNLRHRRRPM
jgi:hypothetical protein